MPVAKTIEGSALTPSSLDYLCSYLRNILSCATVEACEVEEMKDELVSSSKVQPERV